MISGHLIRPSQAYFCYLSAPSASGEGQGMVLVERGRGMVLYVHALVPVFLSYMQCTCF